MIQSCIFDQNVRVSPVSVHAAYVCGALKENVAPVSSDFEKGRPHCLCTLCLCCMPAGRRATLFEKLAKSKLWFPHAFCHGQRRCGCLDLSWHQQFKFNVVPHVRRVR